MPVSAPPSHNACGGLSKTRLLCRVAAEAQRRADALGPAAESALQAADGAVRAARLAAVKLRAQVQRGKSIVTLP